MKIVIAVLILALGGIHVARAAVVDPDPHSLLKTKKILVLDGGALTSHDKARNAATADLKAIQANLGLAMTFSTNWQTPVFAGYDIVVFNYFFESQKITPAGQKNMQDWLATGHKGYVGYHTSGANQETEWNWYRDNVTTMLYNLHANPEQTGTIHANRDAAILKHPIMKGLDTTWSPSDEWYDFGYPDKWKDCKVTYYLDEGTLKKYTPPRPMLPHPIAWYREDPATKDRFYYSAFVHTPEGAASDFFHSTLLRALEYVANYEDGYETTGISDISSNGNSIRTWKNVSYITDSRQLRVDVPGSYSLSISSAKGEKLFSSRGQGPQTYAPEAFRKPGLYFVQFNSKSKNFTQRVMVY